MSSLITRLLSAYCLPELQTQRCTTDRSLPLWDLGPSRRDTRSDDQGSGCTIINGDQQSKENSLFFFFLRAFKLRSWPTVEAAWMDVLRSRGGTVQTEENKNKENLHV